MDEEQLLNAEIEDHHVEEKKVEEAKQVKLIGIVILATGLLCASSFASIFNSYGDVSPFIKNIWRCQMVLAFLICYCLIVGWGNDKEKKFAKTFNGNCYLFISGVAVTCCQVSFMTCAWYTISSHAYILGSLSGVIIIIVKVVLKLETHFLERVGTIAVIIGAVFLMFDKDATKIDLEEETLLGDLIAILSSIFLAAYITLNHKLQQETSILIIIIYNFFVSLIVSIFIVLIVENENLSNLLSFDTKIGFFGCYSSELICVSLLALPISLGIVGGYNLSLRYFAPHVVGMFMFFEPILAQFLGCLLQQDNIPGTLTFIGVFIVIPGVFIHSVPSMFPKETEKIFNTSKQDSL